MMYTCRTPDRQAYVYPTPLQSNKTIMKIEKRDMLFGEVWEVTAKTRTGITVRAINSKKLDAIEEVFYRLQNLLKCPIN